MGGPNFYKFDDNVLYEIKVDTNDGGGVEDVVTFQFRFKTTVTRSQHRFLYNTGPHHVALSSPTWNVVRQTYTVTRIDGRRGSSRTTVLGQDLPTPPVNVGIRSTPNYDALANQAITHSAERHIQVFAGQRDDPFFVDLNVFDLLAVRRPPTPIILILWRATTCTRSPLKCPSNR